MKFVLQTILVKYDNAQQKRNSYLLESDKSARVVITTVCGSKYAYDLAYSNNLSEVMAEALFMLFMDKLDALEENGNKLTLGEVFEIDIT